MPWHHRQRRPQGLYGGKTVVDLVFKYGERLLADENIAALEDEEAKRAPAPKQQRPDPQGLAARQLRQEFTKMATLHLKQRAFDKGEQALHK